MNEFCVSCTISLTRNMPKELIQTAKINTTGNATGTYEALTIEMEAYKQRKHLNLSFLSFTV